MTGSTRSLDDGDDTGYALDDVLPVVGDDRGNLPLWIGIAAILTIAVVLFVFLESRRQHLLMPATKPKIDQLVNAPSLALPPLVLPPEATVTPAVRDRLSPAVAGPAKSESPEFATVYRAAPPPAAIFTAPVPERPSSGDGTSPAIVYDTAGSESGQIAGAPPSNATPQGPAITMAQRPRPLRTATIIPQGTLIAAVLETALDSTQPGQARAIITQNVTNIAGDKVLIPRGSRLFGDYKADLSPGQKRAFVQWTRLIRPDGVWVAIDSPAADLLGRSGISGKVNNHIAERFGGALLQSAVQFGMLAASQAVLDSSVIVALPGLQNTTGQVATPPPRPTLRVPQGSRISVFVSRDLDFASVE